MGLLKDASKRPFLVRARVWRLPLSVVIMSALVAVGGDRARQLLRYEREAIGDGELWRLLSGHVVHLGAAHWLLNAAGLLLVWTLVADSLDSRRWLMVLGVTIAGIDVGFWLLERQLEWYVGLSGLLHGMLAAGIVAGWNRDRWWFLALGAILVAKLLYEQLLGPLPGSESSTGGTVVIAAHLYGAIAGALASGVLAIGAPRAPI